MSKNLLRKKQNKTANTESKKTAMATYKTSYLQTWNWPFVEKSCKCKKRAEKQNEIGVK